MGFGMIVCPVSIALKSMLSQTLSVYRQVDTQGMVGSVEAFFSDEEAGPAVFETNYIITANGVEEITPIPHLYR